jgi:hypothetical protein
VSATRFDGFCLTPTFVEHGPNSPVSVAVDDATLTMWVGVPENVWQTPLNELHQLTVTVGRQLTVGFTVAGVRYQLSARRVALYDELIDRLRAKGAHVVRSHRARAVSVFSVVAVVLAASVSSIFSVWNSASTPSASELGALNVQRTDLPNGFRFDASGVLINLVGSPNEVISSATTTPTTKGLAQRVFNAVTKNYERCMHESHAVDRLYGTGGAIPDLQVSGRDFRSSADGGIEIASATQYYSTTAMVNDDIAQYSSPRFGKCWALSSGQLLSAALDDSLKGANKALPVTNYTAYTLAHGWRRGGVATLTDPTNNQNIYLVTVLAAQGHDEVAYYALTLDPSSAQSVITQSLGAVVARMAPATSTGSA